MTAEFIAALAVLIGAILTFAGGLIGHFVTSKRSRKELEANTKKEIDAVQQQLIDQLQEERNRLDTKIQSQQEYHDTKMTEQQARHDVAMEKLNERISEFWEDKATTRRYVSDLETDNANLRRHIILELPPPPPGEAPKPPDGYKP